MSRSTLAASLFALVLVAGVLAPRLHPTDSAPVAAVTPHVAAVPETMAGIPEVRIPETAQSPGTIIPEATEPMPAAPPPMILPEAPIDDWDGCPACGMG